MKPVLIDFAPPSPMRALWRCGPWQLTALLASLLALCAGLYLLQQTRSPAPPIPAASWVQATAAKANTATLPLAQIAAVNQAVQQLNTPWSELRAALATASVPGTALLTVEPDAPQGRVMISAESRTSAEMFRYLAALKRQAFFKQVELRSHEAQEQGLRFQVEAHWGRP